MKRWSQIECFRTERYSVETQNLRQFLMKNMTTDVVIDFENSCHLLFHRRHRPLEAYMRTLSLIASKRKIRPKKSSKQVV